jgi:predicted nucleotidyltransferase
MDSLVEKVTSRIASELAPEKIILFGSRARGDAGPDSDIDLLIIYDGPMSKREVKLFVQRLFPERDFSMDVFVLSSDEYARQQNVVSTVGRAAAISGESRA